MVKEILYFKMNVGMPNDLKLAGGVCVCVCVLTYTQYDIMIVLRQRKYPTIKFKIVYNNFYQQK